MVSVLHMFIKQKTHFFILCKTKHIMALQIIQKVLSLCYFYFLPWLMIFTSLVHHSQVQPSPFDLWYFIFSFFRVSLIFEKAVTLILKHANLLRLTHLPEPALTYAELNYQKANIDVAIQQHLMAHPQEHSVEEFAGFIMGTDIGLCILHSVISIFYHPFRFLTKWLKHLLKSNLMTSLFFASS
jgi:hypothetical protein